VEKRHIGYFCGETSNKQSALYKYDVMIIMRCPIRRHHS